MEGKRHGEGKEYDFDGNIEFEGEFIKGEKKVRFNKILIKYINF